MSETKPVILIVDGNNWIYRYYRVVPPKMVHNRRVESAAGCYKGIVNLRATLAMKYKTKALAIVVQDCDADNVEDKSFRYKVFPSYKINSEGMPADLKSQEPLLASLLEAKGIPVIRQPNLEGDDVIAILATRYSDLGYDVVISTTDKDLHQIVTSNILIFNPQTKNFVGPTETREKFLVNPKDINLLLAFEGDDQDGIPGVPGIGKKTAAKWINTYGDIGNIIAAARDKKIIGQAADNLLSKINDIQIFLQLTTLLTDKSYLSQESQLKARGIPGNPLRLHFLLKELGMPKDPEVEKFLSQQPSNVRFESTELSI